jgi:predicted deacetylase
MVMPVRRTHHHFLVVVHDVTPHAYTPLQIISKLLYPFVGTNVAAAVVPCWHGVPLNTANPGFLEFVRAAYGELLLHGYTHHTTNSGLIALLTEQANEFTRAPALIALKHLQRGRAILADLFTQAITGFVPPAWQVGPVTPQLLRHSGLHYRMGLGSLTAIDTTPQPLAVASWDCGRIAALGLAGEAIAAVQYVRNPAALPCIVLHPRDLARGYCARALYLIQHLLAAGWQPILPGSYIQRYMQQPARSA